MIDKFVQAWETNKDKVRAILAEKHPENYKAIVHAVISNLRPADGGDSPDPERIHEIDDGSYQGTLIYVIGETGYQPSTYWAAEVSYGSCSGCDTLEGIRGYEDGVPSESQVSEYMGLALNVVQGLKKIAGYGE